MAFNLSSDIVAHSIQGSTDTQSGWNWALACPAWTPHVRRTCDRRCGFAGRSARCPGRVWGCSGGRHPSGTGWRDPGQSEGSPWGGCTGAGEVRGETVEVACEKPAQTYTYIGPYRWVLHTSDLAKLVSPHSTTPAAPSAALSPSVCTRSVCSHSIVCVCAMQFRMSIRASHRGNSLNTVASRCESRVARGLQHFVPIVVNWRYAWDMRDSLFDAPSLFYFANCRSRICNR